MELDKTAEDFRRAHFDRQELLSRWQMTIDQMQRRDEAMDLLAAVCALQQNTVFILSLYYFSQFLTFLFSEALMDYLLVPIIAHLY